VKTLPFERAVALGWKPGDHPMSKLVLEPVERNPWVGTVGAEYSKNGSEGNLSITHRNVFGSAESLTGVLTATPEGSLGRAELIFQVPKLGFPESWGMRIFTAPNIEMHQPWKQTQKGFAIFKTIGDRRFGQNRFEYSCASRYLVPLPTAPFEIRQSAGPSFISSVQHTHVVDRRDMAEAPSAGYAYKFLTQLAGLGGDVKFFKHQSTVQYNVPLPLSGWAKGFSLNFLLRGEAIVPLGGDQVRVADRLWGGGPVFKPFGMGPHSIRGRQPLGGDLGYTASVYLRSGNLTDDLPLHIHSFLTATNLTNNGITTRSSYSSIKNLLDPKEARVMAGVGLVVPGPFGRLEVNFAHPLRVSHADRLSTDFVAIGLHATFGDI